MSNGRRPKQPASVHIEALKSDAATVTKLASRPGGVSVVDDTGRVAFRLVIPNKALD